MVEDGKGFFHRWRKGIERVTPVQLLRGKRLAMVGQLFGFCIAIVYLVTMTAYWYWLVFLWFTFLFLILEFVGLQKQIHEAEKYEGIK
jgi:fatty acid desaturase